jgi:hypothetical protein
MLNSGNKITRSKGQFTIPEPLWITIIKAEVKKVIWLRGALAVVFQSFVTQMGGYLHMPNSR